MSLSPNRVARVTALAIVAALGLASALPARAADSVRVAVFPVASSLPYWVALDRGYFKDAGIEVETVKLIGGPPIVAAMIGNQVDAAINLVTIEGMNANTKKPGVVNYIEAYVQNAKHQMEQFVVRSGFAAASVKDLKGAKIMSAPGPANVKMAQAVLAANGLRTGDYQLSELDPAEMVAAMRAGTFDAGYVLEPQASMMKKIAGARTLEGGLIAHYVLGSPDANAFVGGCALTGDFIAAHPDAARRFAAAIARAVRDVDADPSTRKYLAQNTTTPSDVADSLPMLQYVMVKDMKPADKTALQKFIDFSVSNGTLTQNVDVAAYLKAL